MCEDMEDNGEDDQREGAELGSEYIVQYYSKENGQMS